MAKLETRAKGQFGSINSMHRFDAVSDDEDAHDSHYNGDGDGDSDNDDDDDSNKNDVALVVTVKWPVLKPWHSTKRLISV